MRSDGELETDPHHGTPCGDLTVSFTHVEDPSAWRDGEKTETDRDGGMEAQEDETHTQTASSIQDKIEVQMGFREMEEGCQKERRWGLKKGRSVRRCPEIQDVVIRQLGERECEIGR